MVNADAHNTVDAQMHVGEPYRMRVNGAHNTIGKMSAPTILLCQGGCRVLFLQVYRVRSLVSWFDLCACLTFSVHFLVPTERESPVGGFQSALIMPVGEKQ